MPPTEKRVQSPGANGAVRVSVYNLGGRGCIVDAVAAGTYNCGFDAMG